MRKEARFSYEENNGRNNLISRSEAVLPAWAANGNKWGDFAGSIVCDLSPVIGTQSGIY